MTTFAALPVSWSSADAAIADQNGRATPEFRRWLDQTRRYFEGLPALGRAWDVQGLSAQNEQSVNGATKMSISAESLALYNPNTRARINIDPGDVPDLTCSISSQGQNGRDQASAFTWVSGAPPNLNWYATADSAGNVSSLVSQTAPLGTNANNELGPVLQGNDIAYVRLWPSVLSDADSLIFDTRQNDESTRGTFNGYISGTTLHVTTVVSGAAIAIGKRLRGAGVLNNTLITAGAGVTWTVSKSQTVGSLGTPVGMVTTTPATSNLVVEGRKAKYSASNLHVFDDLIGMDNTFVAGDYSACEFEYRDWIPSDALEFNMLMDPEISSDESAPGLKDGLTTSGFFVRWRDVTLGGSGNDIFLSMYAYGNSSTPSANNPGFDFPVTAQMKLFFVWLQGGGVTYSTTTVGATRSFTW